MDYKEIESLKLALLSLAKKGCKIRIISKGIDGRIIGVGYKPYWTTPNDSIIEKLEINYLDDHGRIRTYWLNSITGYDVISNDGRDYDSMKNACIDIEVFSEFKRDSENSLEKVRIEIYSQ